MPGTRAVPFSDFTIEDRFWSPRIETNRRKTAWHCLEQLEKAGNLHNFRIAAEGRTDGYMGPLYMDSDLYKAMEGVALLLQANPDSALESELEKLVGLVAPVQMPDGYLNTWHQVNRPDARWSNLRDAHELYCAGHLFEAAVAHEEATGKPDLLDVALRFADHIARRFGAGGIAAYPGHPEIELALFKLADHTGDERWSALAKRFLDNRGNGYFAREHGQDPAQYDGAYWIDDAPLRDQRVIKGHAVRACYLMSGAAELAMRTGEPALTKMLREVWANATERKRYLTGGIGSSASNEGFTEDYDLPNATAYQETCASVALAQWGARMNRLTGDPAYVEPLETALYNAVPSGVGLEGKSFFYANPLASEGDKARASWFQCACCPPNLLRTLGSIGGFAFTTSEDTLFVNLFIGGRLHTRVGGRSLTVKVETDYPWDGSVRVAFAESTAMHLGLRLPEWCRAFTLRRNGEPCQFEKGSGYLLLNGPWSTGDSVDLILDMPVERVLPHPMVQENKGKVAVRRGPLVYCLEGEDMSPLGNDVPLNIDRGEGVFAGATLIRTDESPARTFIPYAFWANRGPLPMAVWLPT